MRRRSPSISATRPPARHGDLLGVRERGAQLALQLDPRPAGLEHHAEAVGDVGEQVRRAGRAGPARGLAVDREHADLLGAVPDRHLDQVRRRRSRRRGRSTRRCGRAAPAAARSAGRRSRPAHGATASATRARSGASPSRRRRQRRPGQRGDVGEHAVGRGPRPVEQPVDDPLGADVQRPERQRDQRPSPAAVAPPAPSTPTATVRSTTNAAAPDRHHEQHREAAAEPALGGPQPVVAGGDQHDDGDRGRRQPGEPEQQRDRGVDAAPWSSRACAVGSTRVRPGASPSTPSSSVTTRAPPPPRTRRRAC